MASITWWLVDVASRFLEPDEREAVRGDLAEAGDSAWRGLTDILGLVVLRQTEAGLWRPWLTPIGLALIGSLLLVGILTIRQPDACPTTNPSASVSAGARKSGTVVNAASVSDGIIGSARHAQ